MPIGMAWIAFSSSLSLTERFSLVMVHQCHPVKMTQRYFGLKSPMIEASKARTTRTNATLPIHFAARSMRYCMIRRSTASRSRDTSDLGVLALTECVLLDATECGVNIAPHDFPPLTVTSRREVHAIDR